MTNENQIANLPAANPKEELVESESDADSGDDALQQTQDAGTAKPKAKKKKKKSKKKKADGVVVEVAAQSEGPVTAAPVAPAATAANLLASTGIQALLERLAMRPEIMYKKPKSQDDYQFWKTQPVPKTTDEILEDGVIEEDKDISEVKQDPYPLHDQFEWCTLDITQESQIKELYELLSLNYVEDDDASFRFDYSAEFLKWALQPPGWKSVWHLGVRVKSNKKLVAFISAIPADMKIHKVTKKLVEINFLCIHKKLRSKRLAPVLIKEITRLVNLTGIFQAVYTAGAVLPKAISTCRYFHRSLQVKKLVETEFCGVRPDDSIAAMIKRAKLPESPLLLGTRKMEERDVKAVHKLLTNYLSQFEVAPVLSEEEVRHWLLPVDTVIFSYVVEDSVTNQITDFYSFYSLPSSVIGCEKHSHLYAAYLFYYAPSDNGAGKSRTQAIIKDALIQARNNGFDVFNCLNLMKNSDFIEALQFARGDGNLHYYLYNYRCTNVPPEGMGLVLL